MNRFIPAPLCISVLALTLLLGGCSSQNSLNAVVPPEDQANVRYNIELLQQRRFAELTKNVDPSAQGPDLPAELEKMAANIPAGQPTSVKLVGAHWLSINGETKRNMIFEYEFSGHWLLVNLTTVTSGSSTKIAAFRIQPLTDSLENQNRFTLHGKGVAQYGALTFAVLEIVFCIVVFIVCLRTQGLRKKWLWAILCLVSVVRINVNWTTGEFSSKLFYFNIPPAGLDSQLYGPWMLYAGIPVGAIAFLVIRALRPRPDSL